MKENPTWIIIDLKTNLPIHGVGDRTMAFSTKEVAVEIADQLFNKSAEYLIVSIPDLKLL